MLDCCSPARRPDGVNQFTVTVTVTAEEIDGMGSGRNKLAKTAYHSISSHLSMSTIYPRGGEEGERVRFVDVEAGTTTIRYDI